jgi:hypothetical protein
VKPNRYIAYMASAIARARAIYDLPSAVPVPPRMSRSLVQHDRARRERAMEAIGWQSA